MKITYKTVRFTAKSDTDTVNGKFTPDGKPETFYSLLQSIAKKLTGTDNISNVIEKQYEWGSTVWFDSNNRKIIMFLHF